MSGEDSPPNAKSLNLEDIAAKAGVSRSTVSRVINNEPYVRQKTRERVLAVIEREGFTPNPAARMLVTQRTRIIGVVIPSTINVVFEDPFYFPTLLHGVSEIANERDYAMLLWMQESSKDEDRFYQRMLSNRLMDGLVLASATANSPVVSRLVEIGMPFVMVERPGQHQDRISYVTVDNVTAARVAVEHLINLGRRRIATVTGALNNVDGQDRLQGYRDALAAAGLAYRHELVAEGQFTRRSGYLGARKLLSQDVDAIFAASDQTAMGVMDALHEAGVQVPDDVAVVGFDDLPSATRSKPSLTTIRHPIQQKGFRAAALLLDLIEGQVDSPRQVLLPTQLVIRESCGAMTMMIK